MSSNVIAGGDRSIDGFNTDNNLVVNNICYQPTSAFFCESSSPAKSTVFADNIVFEPSANAISVVGVGPFRIHGNIIKGSGSDYGVNTGGTGPHYVQNNDIRNFDRGVYNLDGTINVSGNRFSSMNEFFVVLSQSGADSWAVVSNNHGAGTVTNDGVFVNASHCSVMGNTMTDANINESGGDYNIFGGNVAPGGLSGLNTNSIDMGNITA